MLDRLNRSLRFYAQFHDFAGTMGASSKRLKSGLTVTVTVLCPNGSGGHTAVTGSATEASGSSGAGNYYYDLASGSVTNAGWYIAIFHTTDSTVEAQDVADKMYIGAPWLQNLDTALSGIAAAVWAVTLSSIGTSGTTGANIKNVDAAVSSRSSTDPLLASLPGSYASNTAGGALSKLLGAGGTSPVTVVSPVASGGAITLINGDDYYQADNNRALTWVDTAGIWPTLATGTTIEFKVAQPAGTVGSGFTKAVDIVSGTGSNKTVRLELTATETGQLYTLQQQGAISFKIVATLVTSSHKVTLVASTFVVQ